MDEDNIIAITEMAEREAVKAVIKLLAPASECGRRPRKVRVTRDSGSTTLMLNEHGVWVVLSGRPLSGDDRQKIERLNRRDTICRGTTQDLAFGWGDVLD